MRITVFDTETTGLYKKNNNLAAQPHVIQLAYAQYENQTLISETEAVLNYNVDVPERAAQVHGFTREKINEVGVDPIPVWLDFQEALMETDLLVAHNSSFDVGMVNVSCERDDMEDLRTFLLGTEVACTMMMALPIVKAPARWGNGYKWPNLSETHIHLFGEDFEGAHDALADVRACARIYHELIQMGVPVRGGTNR